MGLSTKTESHVPNFLAWGPINVESIDTQNTGCFGLVSCTLALRNTIHDPMGCPHRTQRQTLLTYHSQTPAYISRFVLNMVKKGGVGGLGSHHHSWWYGWMQWMHQRELDLLHHLRIVKGLCYLVEGKGLWYTILNHHPQLKKVEL